MENNIKVISSDAKKIVIKNIACKGVPVHVSLCYFSESKLRVIRNAQIAAIKAKVQK